MGHDGPDLFEQLGLVQAGGLHDHFQLIVVGGQDGRARDRLQQLLARKRGDLLAGVEDVGHAHGAILARQFDHVLDIARRDDGHARRGIGLEHVVSARIAHGRRVESRNLVVRLVRGDVGAGREVVLHDADAVHGQTVLFEPGPVIVEILAHAGEDQRLLPQQGEVVGDVARSAAETLLQTVHKEADVQDVDLVRQNVVLKPSRKSHDAVYGQGAGNINLHASSCGYANVREAAVLSQPWSRVNAKGRLRGAASGRFLADPAQEGRVSALDPQGHDAGAFIRMQLDHGLGEPVHQLGARLGDDLRPLRPAPPCLPNDTANACPAGCSRRRPRRRSTISAPMRSAWAISGAVM